MCVTSSQYIEISTYASAQLGLAALNQYCAGYNCLQQCRQFSNESGSLYRTSGRRSEEEGGTTFGLYHYSTKADEKRRQKNSKLLPHFSYENTATFSFPSRYSSIQLLFHTRLGIFRFLDSSKGDRQTDFLRTYCQKVPRPAADFSYYYFLSLINRKERPPLNIGEDHLIDRKPYV